MKVGEYLKRLAVQSGIPSDAKFLDAIVADDVELPVEVENVLNSLLTIDAAKNNPDLKKHFHAQVLNGADRAVYDTVDEFGLPPEFKEELKKLDTPYIRMIAAMKKVKEVEEKKALEKIGDKDASAKEIARLNKEALDRKTEFENILKAEREKTEGSILEYAIDSFLESKQYANDGVPKKVNKMTARNLLQDDLQANKIKVVRQDGNLKLVQAESPDQDYYLENKPVSATDYFDKLLGTNKMLKVTDPKQPGKQQPPVITGDPKQPSTMHIVTAIDQQLEQIKAAS